MVCAVLSLLFQHPCHGSPSSQEPYSINVTKKLRAQISKSIQISYKFQEVAKRFNLSKELFDLKSS